MPVTQADIDASLTSPSALGIIYQPNPPSPPQEDDKATVFVPLSTIKDVSALAWKPLPLAARMGGSSSTSLARRALTLSSRSADAATKLSRS